MCILPLVSFVVSLFSWIIEPKLPTSAEVEGSRMARGTPRGDEEAPTRAGEEARAGTKLGEPEGRRAPEKKAKAKRGGAQVIR
jgi:hypothetical protein